MKYTVCVYLGNILKLNIRIHVKGLKIFVDVYIVLLQLHQNLIICSNTLWSVVLLDIGIATCDMWYCWPVSLVEN